MVRAHRDHVDIGRVGVVRAHEPDEEPDRQASGVLHQPRRPAEVLEPQPGQVVVQLPSAPPLVHEGHDRRVVGVGRSAERETVLHRELQAATSGATTSCTGASRPERLGEVVEERQDATLRSREQPQPICPRTIAATAMPTASQRRVVGRIVPAEPSRSPTAMARPAGRSHDDQAGRDQKDAAQDGDREGRRDRGDDGERDPSGGGAGRLVRHVRRWRCGHGRSITIRRRPAQAALAGFGCRLGATRRTLAARWPVRSGWWVRASIPSHRSRAVARGTCGAVGSPRRGTASTRTLDSRT